MRGKFEVKHNREVITNSDHRSCKQWSVNCQTDCGTSKSLATEAATAMRSVNRRVCRHGGNAADDEAHQGELGVHVKLHNIYLWLPFSTFARKLELESLMHSPSIPFHRNIGIAQVQDGFSTFLLSVSIPRLHSMSFLLRHAEFKHRSHGLSSFFNTFRTLIMNSFLNKNSNLNTYTYEERRTSPR